jgi:hypothetical protein
MAESLQRDWKSLAFVGGAVGIVFLQIPMAYIGTELGWANGVEVGVQTYKTGMVFGIGLGILFSVLCLTAGIRWIRPHRPVVAFATLVVLGGIVSVATFLFTMLRAAASFHLSLEP